MLLLPLLILWAQTPMQFPRFLMRSLTSVVVLIAIALPIFGDHIATGAEHDMQGNRMRSDSQFAEADDNSNPMRPEKMREGTLIPPTVGRFIPAGRRWMFVPDSGSEKSDDLAVHLPAKQVPPTNVFRSASTGFQSITTSRSAAGGSILGNRLREPVHPASDTQFVMKPEAAASADQDGNPSGLRQIMTAENLMLQRIVEAIRIDGADNRWTISGRLTEYFDENRLQIRTAERATAN